MNRLCQELSQICRDALLDQKWILAPSLRVGHQWLDRITLAGAPLVNVRIKTLKGMALDMAGPDMVDQGLSLVSGAGSLVILNAIITDLAGEPLRYLSSVPVTPGLARTVLTTVTALRQAGLTPETLDARHFEAPEKAADLSLVLARYVEALSEGSLVDYADVLRMAGEAIQRRPMDLPHVLVLVPEDLDLTAAERGFLDCLPPDSLRTIPVDQPAHDAGPDSAVSSDGELLRWILEVPDAPAPLFDGTAEIFHASGEANEVREVLRRCLSGGRHLDEVELLHTDTATYVPLVFETLMRLEPDPRFDTPSLPVTFAEGIPVRYARPGRLLAAWLVWMQQGYPQLLLMRMMQEGLLAIREANGDGTTLADLASELRNVKIGMGRENYLPVLEYQASDVREAGDSPGRNAPGGEDAGDSPPQVSRQRSALLRLVAQLLELCPSDPHCGGQELLACAEGLVSTMARRTNELDNYAAKAMLERIEEMAFWIRDQPDLSGFAIRDWLATLPDEIRIGGSGPRPGCLHVAHIDTGGHSGRAHTFVMGLDDARFPGAGLNDPLLLDAEREKLSPDLPKAVSQLARRMEKFALLLARLRGNITLSYSSLDLTDDRDTFPCSSLLSAYRILSGNRKGDQTEMLRWLPEPAGFAPESQQQCLDSTEWWLSRLCGPNAATGVMEFIENVYPHLAHGRVAAEARESDEFTEYDGRLLDPPPTLDPFSDAGPVMSTARLEQMGRCPLSYFFRYVLRIKLPESMEADPARWLEPGLFGDLLHEIFYRFMSRLIEERRLPLYDRDRPLLFKTVEEMVQRYARIYPPAATSAFERQLRHLERAARIFLIEEEELCRDSRPVYLEAAIGLGSDLEVDSPLRSQEPVSVVVSPDKTVRLAARIDRIDQTGTDDEATFAIWDYKSGSPWKYEKPDRFWQGRVIQHAVYLEVARHILRKRISPAAEVLRFGYFFPSQGARGLRLLHWKHQLEHAREVIERLCLIASTGAFLATDNARDDCTFCDYRVICRDVESVAAAARRKLENRDNDILEPIRNLRGITGDARA